MNDLFLSHSEKDRRVAEIIAEGLEQAGFFVYGGRGELERGLSPQAPFLGQLARAIGKAKALILLVSPEAMKSAHIEMEVAEACQLGKVCVLVLLDLSLEEVYQTKPGWRLIPGPVTSIRTSPGAAAEITPRLIAGLKAMGVGIEASPPGETPQPRESAGGYEVFISYRRKRDDSTARLIRKELKGRGFRVFLDVDDLRTGLFDEALLDHIKKAPGFILILSRGSLNRCADAEDWLRKEIACALASRRTIVPIMMPGFRFPLRDKLPDVLRALPQHNGVTYSHVFFDAMIEKIIEFLKPRG